jgi:hypothetical protein
VSWTAPSSDGGSAITGYTITSYLNAAAQTSTQAGASATSVTVGGLTNGAAYSFRVAATNGTGIGPDSGASSAVTPRNTIFDLGVPSTVDAGDPASVELGVKFQSDVAGSILGVRFYKAPGNTATHTGSLWTAGGQRLAQATFSSETASGWQTVTFASPVQITAGTSYIASYFAPNGHYSVTSSQFSTTGVSNAPLRALANPVTPNGVYAYGPASGFPSNSFNSTNYWVDVVFAPSP